MLKSVNNVYEKSANIPIQKSPKSSQLFEHSLNHSFFDPYAQSPPDDFKLKLYQRYNTYTNSCGVFDKK